MKKYLISTFALTMIFSSCVNVHANNKITDISNHWAKKQISHFIENSYAKGYEDNTFKPDKQITRAEFVKLVNKYFGFNNKGISKFKDINQSNWYYNDVCIAVQAGYINGYEDNTFRPDNLITREEASKIIVSIKNQQDNTYDKLNTFPDKHLVSNWAKPYIEGAIENGYLKGDHLKNLRPTNHITRAESVTLLSRIDRKDVVKPVVNDEDHKDVVKPVINNDDHKDVVKPVVNDDENEYYIKSMIEDLNNFPRLNFNYISFSVKKGEQWNNNMINATAVDQEYRPLQVHYDGNVDTSTPGFYTVKISATDDNGKTNTREVYIEVVDPIVLENLHLYPQIISKNLTLKKGSLFDYKMLEATSFDTDEKDISDTITYKGFVDTNKKGIYPVYISATDKKGLTSTLLVLVRIY